VRQRRARTQWRRTLIVGIVVVRLGPVDEDAILAMTERLHDLEDLLASEMKRYDPGAIQPFEMVLAGPVDVATPPPTVPAGDGVFQLAEYAFDKWRYLSRVDAAAALRGHFDSRIYVFSRPPKDERKKTVEGASEDGGRVGMVEVELDETMADFALFVATHELLHTLGATDKYDDLGRAREPEGLAEPELVPVHPQRWVEVMARTRPLGPGADALPDRIEELRVGERTAREIGWLR
jgi:hypothetical protein